MDRYTDVINGFHALIDAVGDNPNRKDLRDTPGRAFKAYREMLSGYEWTEERICELFKVFSEDSDEMIVAKDIDFVSVCEHHLLPFTGVAHVGYLPARGQVVGLSKIPRLVDVYAKRLQIQENLTKVIANTMDKHLNPRGVGCVIEATHSCVTSRGVMKPNVRMITSYLTGAFKEDPATRMEFFRLIGK